MGRKSKKAKNEENVEQEIPRVSNVPKVFILGVQRSGKTVFLSVLGMKFMLVEYGGIAAPLGFRLEPQDEDTVNLVRKKYAELQQGHWPGSTSERDMTRLRWTVYTGGRPIFDLATMDCSGEQIRKAFAVSAGGWGDSPSVSDSDTVADALLSSGGAESGVGEFRVEEIREAVKEASLVCLFVNAADYPAGAAGAALRKNFEDTVDTFWRLLKQDTDLANKSLLVLTQTHLVRETIENMGGPSLYLCARGAQHLQQEVERCKIPVICVSAVNELNSENAVPETIESDGLFGFLLTVGGIVAGENDKLYTLKERYQEFLRRRNEFARQLTVRAVLPSRFPALKEFVVAAEAFREGCLEYVRDPANMSQQRIENLYQIATEQDHDVKDADEKWRSRLKVDEVWMRQVLKLIGRQTSVQLGDNEVLSLVDTVKREAKVAFDPLLYGYDMNIGSGIDYQEWVKQSVKAMPTARSGDWTVLESEVKTLCNGIGQVRGTVGKEGFDQAAEDLVKHCKGLEKLTARFRILWLDYSDDNDEERSRLDGFEKESRTIQDECYGLMSRNKKVLHVREESLAKLESVREQMKREQFSAAKKTLRELERMAVSEPFSRKRPDEISMRELGQFKEEWKTAVQALRQRRFRTFLCRFVTLLVLVGIGCGGYYGAKWYCDKENREIARKIARYLKDPETYPMAGVNGTVKPQAPAAESDKSGRAMKPKFCNEEIAEMVRELERVCDFDWNVVRQKAGALRNYPLLGITPEPHMRQDFLERLDEYTSRGRLDKIRKVLKRADDYCAKFAQLPDEAQSGLIEDRRKVLTMCRDLHQYAKFPTFDQLNNPNFEFSKLTDVWVEGTGLNQFQSASDRLDEAIIKAERGGNAIRREVSGRRIEEAKTWQRLK